MNRRAEDIAVVVLIGLVWMAGFAASRTWEIAVLGLLTLGGVALLLRKR